MEEQIALCIKAGSWGGSWCKSLVGRHEEEKRVSLSNLAGSPGPGEKDGKFLLWGQGVKFL